MKYIWNLNPVAISFPKYYTEGNIEIRWYGIMYVVGFLLAGFLLKRLAKEGLFKIAVDKIDNYVTYLLIGMFLGARLAYVFIYNWDYYSNHLGELFYLWEGGLSFHGAIIGLILSAYVYCKRNGHDTLLALDSSVIAGTPGLFFGRIGNFINGELFGRETSGEWGVIFPNGGPYPRHPSQLYEGLLEGIVLFLLLWFIRKRVKHVGVIGSCFLIGYGTFRYVIEFFREPDVQLGYFFGGTTSMGQILCLLMILSGITLMIIQIKRDKLIARAR